MIDSNDSFGAFSCVDIDLLTVLASCTGQLIVVIVLLLKALFTVFGVAVEVRGFGRASSGVVELFAFCHQAGQRADALVSADDPLLVVQVGEVVRLFDTLVGCLVVLVGADAARAVRTLEVIVALLAGETGRSVEERFVSGTALFGLGDLFVGFADAAEVGLFGVEVVLGEQNSIGVGDELRVDAVFVEEVVVLIVCASDAGSTVEEGCLIAADSDWQGLFRDFVL